MNNYRMSIDPGYLGTGYALWDEFNWHSLVPPVSTGIIEITNGKGAEWVSRAGDFAVKLQKVLNEYNVSKVYVEFPRLFDSALGHAAMSGEVGDIPKLIFLIGTMAEQFRSRDIEFIPVPVNTWKGQLSKVAVANRIARKLSTPVEMFGSHANDAVGIGLYAKGYFKVSQLKLSV